MLHTEVAYNRKTSDTDAQTCILVNAHTACHALNLLTTTHCSIYMQALKNFCHKYAAPTSLVIRHFGLIRRYAHQLLDLLKTEPQHNIERSYPSKIGEEPFVQGGEPFLAHHVRDKGWQTDMLLALHPLLRHHARAYDIRWGAHHSRHETCMCNGTRAS